jgi:hypothetical protein
MSCGNLPGVDLHAGADRAASLIWIETVSALPRVHHFVAHSHTPRNRWVRFVFGVTAASRNTRFQGGSLGLTWARLAPADRASFAWRLPLFDRLVRERKQLGGHVEAERLRSLEIDHELDFGWL